MIFPLNLFLNLFLHLSTTFLSMFIFFLFVFPATTFWKFFFFTLGYVTLKEISLGFPSRIFFFSSSSQLKFFNYPRGNYERRKSFFSKSLCQSIQQHVCLVIFSREKINKHIYRNNISSSTCWSQFPLSADWNEPGVMQTTFGLRPCWQITRDDELQSLTLSVFQHFTSFY